ncbi:MAG TPA: DUF1553 domain-containing protein [Planctomycetaceae bacterium]|nr:DUF1553 domain-containing protein [Planctomycetaceae bacterium]
MPLVVRTMIVASLVAMNVANGREPVDYTRDVKPLLRQHCYACHGGLKQKGGLRLDTGSAARMGGDSGPAIVAGNIPKSLLLHALTGEAGFKMPPKEQGATLSVDEIDVIRRWIVAGAHSPDNEQPEADANDYWSYQVPQRPTVPRGNSSWDRNAIDAFISAKHQQRDLVPSPESAREIWLRRVYLDLIGLPPKRSELHAFLTNNGDDAYERVVDDLLNRPQYGERWGRHWMDVWRYSDWYGSRNINEIRYSQRHIWRWRDWIVESLNADKGYDLMVREMLAGDELAPDNPDVVRATGFLGRNWYKFDRNVWMFDVVEHTAEAFLGVTMRCARCHDHKYDPLSQQEYYQFRAFFEPHDVRTEPLSLFTEREKDSTLGMVLKDGISRVYDKEGDAPTHLFLRGDDRSPDKDHALAPDVPASLGGAEVTIHPVDLPVTAYYPAMRSHLLDDRVKMAVDALKQAERTLAQSAEAVAQAGRAVATAQRASSELDLNQTEPFLAEDFSKPRKEVWHVINGDWEYENGRLFEKKVGSFFTMVTKSNHPRNFRAKAVYRPLEPGSYRSIGFSFDYVDQGNSQDVYTSTGDATQSVQAFHRKNGKQVYPQSGIVKTKLAVGEVTTLEWEVRGSQLQMWLNGEHKLEYVLPVPRTDGRFAIWVHSGSAEFLSLHVTELVPTLDDLLRSEQEAIDQVAVNNLKRATAIAELESMKARIAAELAKYGLRAGKIKDLSLQASRAAQRVVIAKKQEESLVAEQRLAALTLLNADNATSDSKAVAEAELNLKQAQTATDKAIQALETADGSYEPLGEVYPATSTGRRRALAKWITAANNPRTSRVAVNQIWMRHFGQPLVKSVSNLGTNGAEPSHPQLLDWLAMELVDNGWRMKPIHHLLVLSATYRQSSSSDREEPADADNRYLWRMNSQRMQAEVVRDSLLFLADSLDVTSGGAEIPESDGESVLRRSLYFRNTPNEQMQMLSVFDMANPNRCYRRHRSVVPQQALALMNSGLALDQSRKLAESLAMELDAGEDTEEQPFVVAAFETILNRSPTNKESSICRQFLADHLDVLRSKESRTFAPGGTAKRAPSADLVQRARENLIQVLFSHNEFVTIR